MCPQNSIYKIESLSISILFAKPPLRYLYTRKLGRRMEEDQARIAEPSIKKAIQPNLYNDISQRQNTSPKFRRFSIVVQRAQRFSSPWEIREREFRRPIHHPPFKLIRDTVINPRTVTRIAVIDRRISRSLTFLPAGVKRVVLPRLVDCGRGENFRDLGQEKRIACSKGGKLMKEGKGEKGERYHPDFGA